MTDPDPEKLSFEQAIEEIEAIVQQIEQGKIGLAESLTRYQRGAALLKRCRGILDVAEQQIEKLTVEQAEEPSSK
ncbi:MAG: exodeoxyribonuclease VII small subunit [Planctomycetota bacterium]|jgi:exodeoxyribonuclease VII small subunit